MRLREHGEHHTLREKEETKRARRKKRARGVVYVCEFKDSISTLSQYKKHKQKKNEFF